jgi:hypothetical protein
MELELVEVSGEEPGNPCLTVDQLGTGPSNESLGKTSLDDDCVAVRMFYRIFNQGRAPCPAGGSGGEPSNAISGHGIGGDAIGEERTGGREVDAYLCVVRVGSLMLMAKTTTTARSRTRVIPSRRSYPSFRRLPQQPISAT